jgi:hypothetical protein
MLVIHFGIRCFWIRNQGRIQDFKLGGAHLKKLRRAEGGANIFGVFHVKNHIFSNFWGARAGCPPHLDPPLETPPAVGISNPETPYTSVYNYYVYILYIQTWRWNVSTFSGFQIYDGVVHCLYQYING